LALLPLFLAACGYPLGVVPATPQPSEERVALERLDQAPSPAADLRFLKRFPCSPFFPVVLERMLAPLAPEEALPVLLHLARHTPDAGNRCAAYLKAGQVAAPQAPEVALHVYTAVAGQPCARAAQARLERVALLTHLGRWEEVARHARTSDDQAEVWSACRALGQAPPPDATGSAGTASRREACLSDFAARFPESDHLDDAWYHLAELALARGEREAAAGLLRRIVDERPQSGRAAAAARRLQEVLAPGGPPGR
jgi:hypothetical protein